MSEVSMNRGACPPIAGLITTFFKSVRLGDTDLVAVRCGGTGGVV